MKVILTKDVEKLGNAGDIVRVKDGYARNYLIPKKFAFTANEKNVKELEFNRRMIAKKIDTEVGAAEALAQKLAKCEIRVEKKVGEEGKLFGSVTTREIKDALTEKGFDIDHRNIILEGSIKKSGVYEVEVKLFREVRGVFKLWVVAEDSDETVAPTAEIETTEIKTTEIDAPEEEVLEEETEEELDKEEE
jgi:large subunit ribosomal protein L9